MRESKQSKHELVAGDPVIYRETPILKGVVVKECDARASVADILGRPNGQNRVKHYLVQWENGKELYHIRGDLAWAPPELWSQVVGAVRKGAL